MLNKNIYKDFLPKGSTIELPDSLEESSKIVWSFYGDVNSNDGSLIFDNTYSMDQDYYYRFRKSLESFHSIFYKMTCIGKPYFTFSVPTAAVQVSTKDYDNIQFVFNPHFWNILDEYSRQFIFCHEMLHIILNHFTRAKSAAEVNKGAINVRQDIVINHLCKNAFKFDPNQLNPFLRDSICWVHTIFKDKNYPEDMNFEWYYNQLPTNFSGDNYFDIHGILNNSVIDAILKKMNSELNNSEKEKLKDLVEAHFEQNDMPALHHQAGDQSGGSWISVDTKAVAKKKKWESVIRNWVRRKMEEKTVDKEHWLGKNRRNNLLHNELIMPHDIEMEIPQRHKKKINLWFFLDTSGSCSGLGERFFKAAKSVPQGPRDLFSVNLFCFDTNVFEVSLKDGKLYGFGGTSFSCIEEYINKTISLKNEDYPDAVFIITDGYGDSVGPKMPEKWYWFLTEGGSDSYIPAKSQKFWLKNFE